MKERVSAIILDLRQSMGCPGFRFHPTDVEIICFHLKRKVIGKHPRRQVIAEIDLYRLEPRELPSLSILQGGDKEYYFFTALDKKYGHGSRTNRATPEGYWKTTGKDNQIYMGPRLVGARKTLVYHSGRAPHGERTNWVMHEFRLEGELVAYLQQPEEIFVCCRIFEKSGAGPKNGEQYGAPFVEEDWEDDYFLSKVPMIENNDGASGSGEHDTSNVQPDDHVQIPATLPVAQLDQPVMDSPSNLDHVELLGNFEDPQNVAHIPQPYFDGLHFPGVQNSVEDINENANIFTGSSSDSGHVELPGNFELQNVGLVPQPCFDAPDFPWGQNLVEDINENANDLNDAVSEARLSNGNYVEMNDFGAVAEEASFGYYPQEVEDADPIFHDASSNHDDLLMGHSLFLELDDLVDDPSVAYSSGQDLVDDYLNNFEEVNENLEQYLASLDSVPSSTSMEEPEVVDPAIPTPEATKDSAIEGTSSSKRKATSFYDAAEDKLADVGAKDDMDGSWGKSWAKRLHGMLGSIPSPPAFAAEDPLKGNVKFVGQSSGTPLSGSVHVEAGMFYVSGFTVASAGPKVWPLQKADEYLLEYSTEHLVSNSVSIPEKQRLGMLRSGGFFLCFLWVLLAVSYKVGTFVCAR
ncbi:hypothetical protein H6P81_014867 [Aristolochia fimbriata]|uniref:NAC domain-containing protein n=1 Tax=Aristolochia fimbriata TaxID=158543 RepID=A0AAV7E3W6_ARIFI|nr:hypothetical protein H6P81_014867 [Aristolochia fimbriata]